MPLLLPTFYYHDHFNEMLAFVEAVYDAVLDECHRAFMGQYKSLAKREQCLFVRMVNRKGHIFPVESLHYPEIGEIGPLLAVLSDRKLARPLRAADYTNLLASMKKDDVLSLAKEAGIADIKPSWPKARLAGHVVERLPYEQAAPLIASNAYVVQEQAHCVDFLLYLYFGKTHESLKGFALRDLGIIRVRDGEPFSARFENAVEARACFFYARWLDRLDQAQACIYSDASEALANAPEATTGYALSLRARLAYKIGLFFEKQKEFDRAVRLYRLEPSPDSNERLVRLLYAQGDRIGAQTLLEAMIDDPGSDDEHAFAADFYARKFERERTGHCTALLREARSITVDDLHRTSPEAGAAAWFRRQDWRVWHTENGFWQGLFGLLFWDELFESGALHSGFDRVPRSLRDKSFAVLFKDAIAQKLEAVGKRRAMPFILKTVAEHWDAPNGIFSWPAVDMEALQDFFTQADPSAVSAIIEKMCRDFYAMSDGFPDLMLVKEGAVKFVEIKAEGDAVRRHQLTRLNQLRGAGFISEICRVDYRFDPQQIYAVIDIETTGGRNASDRITEIGVVKMRNHEVIDEWHSLINPQRHIPGYITDLTGISNGMVAAAPLFSEIANDLGSFLDDAIFAAHNVNFDYGFIASEFRRLDQIIRYPKFCTCAGMRRHYPGHESYSLARLCKTYGIDLDTHHRALCDAKAAGQLLSLINRRREMKAAS